MNDITQQNKNWWQRHWKWIIPSTVIIFAILLCILSSLGSALTDISKSYADKDLFKDAFEKVKKHAKTSEILGELEPIDNLAILEGAVNYSNNNQTFNASIRIVGSKARGKIDINADKLNDVWIYKLIKVRVKKPANKRQTIDVLNLE